MGAKINAMKTKTFLFALYLAISMPAHADLADNLKRFVGYSIVHSGTITGYQDQGKKPNDSFEGCEYGRKIFIDDVYRVTCKTYTYTYSYRPSVVIIAMENSMKMIVGDGVYDISK
jgi:hypothetical protein